VSEKLLPCPFCGSNVELDYYDGVPVAQCPSCEIGITHDSEAIKKWNTRAPDPKVARLVEAARTALANSPCPGEMDLYDISPSIANDCTEKRCWHRELMDALAALEKEGEG